MMTREEIIAANPLSEVLPRYGVELVKKGRELVGRCCFHKDSSPSLRVNMEKGTWYCDPCASGGSVIDFVMKNKGIPVNEAMTLLSSNMREIRPSGDKPKIVAKYDYMDENGELIYQSLRLEPKSFRQRRPSGDKWVWNMEGVRRVPYRLQEVIKCQEVFIVEGEKDADNLSALGYCSTTNVGGAGKWLDAYSDFLIGKDVVVIPDNDKAGKEHGKKVVESISGKVKSLRVIDLPEGVKDVSDVIKLSDEKGKLVQDLIDTAKRIVSTDSSLYSIEELEEKYQEFIKESESKTLDLSLWIQGFKGMRPLVPGELMTIVADTGVGKTATLQSLSVAARPLKTILFEMELPDSLMFERYVQISKNLKGETVEKMYKMGERVNLSDGKKMDHILVCSKSNLGIEEMEQIILKSELKFGGKPAVVMIDYIGLMNSEGKSRYEKISNLAENLKRLAKKTNTIIIISSQIARKDDDDPEIYLHEGKDSGAIENSSGLVLGVWRDPDDSRKMMMKVLKATKGGSGRKIECFFDGERLNLTDYNKTPLKLI